MMPPFVLLFLRDVIILTLPLPQLVLLPHHELFLHGVRRLEDLARISQPIFAVECLSLATDKAAAINCTTPAPLPVQHATKRVRVIVVRDRLARQNWLGRNDDYPRFTEHRPLLQHRVRRARVIGEACNTAHALGVQQQFTVKRGEVNIRNCARVTPSLGLQSLHALLHINHLPCILAQHRAFVHPLTPLVIDITITAAAIIVAVNAASAATAATAAAAAAATLSFATRGWG